MLYTIASDCFLLSFPRIFQPTTGHSIKPTMSVILMTVGVGFLSIIMLVRRLFATRDVVGGLHAEITLPHVESVELYHNETSSNSQKVRTCLHEAGVEFKVRRIGLHVLCNAISMLILWQSEIGQCT